MKRAVAYCLQTPTHRFRLHRDTSLGRLRLKCDGTRAETRFRLSAKRTSPFKSAGAPVQSTTGSRGARISGSNAGYTTFRVSVKRTGYPLHSPVSPSLPLPCVTVCLHVSTGLYHMKTTWVSGVYHLLHMPRTFRNQNDVHNIRVFRYFLQLPSVLLA